MTENCDSKPKTRIFSYNKKTGELRIPKKKLVTTTDKDGNESRDWTIVKERDCIYFEERSRARAIKRIQKVFAYVPPK